MISLQPVHDFGRRSLTTIARWVFTVEFFDRHFPWSNLVELKRKFFLSDLSEDLGLENNTLSILRWNFGRETTLRMEFWQSKNVRSHKRKIFLFTETIEGIRRLRIRRFVRQSSELWSWECTILALRNDQILVSGLIYFPRSSTYQFHSRTVQKVILVHF